MQSRWFARRAMAWSMTLACSAALAAQPRLPVPDAAAEAKVQAALLEMVAEETGAVGPSMPGTCDRLIARAAAVESPVLRYGLLRQAIRCATVAVDVPAGLRAADALAAGFVIDAMDSQFLASLESRGCAAPTALVAGYLAVAMHEGTEDAKFDRAIGQARRIAQRDEPRGLQEYVLVRSEELQQLRHARARLRADGDTSPRRARFRALYLGDWLPLLAEPPSAEDAIDRTVRSKIAARGPGGDVVALAQSGERWLSVCRDEKDSLAQRHLRRRAIDLMVPLVRHVPAPDAASEDLRGEQQRVRRLVEQATPLAAEPGVGALRFASDADLARMLITGGEWCVKDGELRGRSLGPDESTRATARFAWKKIDAVTIRGGVRSADGLNLRIAVGPVNVLLNWECADQNHAWFGDARFETSPRALQAGREHVIVVRQCGDAAVVAVDGKELFCAPARLAGTISVYPAIGSEIFVRSVDVVGDVDLTAVVTGPGVAR